MKDYFRGVEGFTSFALSNLKNISGGGIRCSYVKYKNKRFI
jgi:hypothetical protein